MQVKLFVNSACGLKNINWRYGNLQPYAVIWIDKSAKYSTNVDTTNGENPVWNEIFTIPVPSTLRTETAILYIDIVHAKSATNAKPLVIGSTNLPLWVALDESQSKGKTSFSLDLHRPSGRSHGSLEIQIEIKDSNISYENKPHVQQALVPQPHLQPRPQYQQQQINQYPQTPASPRPTYPANIPQNFMPVVAQRPGNSMFLPNIMPQFPQILVSPMLTYPANRPQNLMPVLAQRPQTPMLLPNIMPRYRPIMQQPSVRLSRMLVRSIHHMEHSVLQGAQGNMDVVSNNGIPYNSMDGTFGEGGFGSDELDFGGFDSSGLDNGGGGFDSSGLDNGGFDDGGFDAGGFDDSGFDYGGFDDVGFDDGGCDF